MRLTQPFDRIPERPATGAFSLRSGLEKWGGDAETVSGIHGMASGDVSLSSARRGKKVLLSRVVGVGHLPGCRLLPTP